MKGDRQRQLYGKLKSASIHLLNCILTIIDKFHWIRLKIKQVTMVIQPAYMTFDI